MLHRRTRLAASITPSMRTIWCAYLLLVACVTCCESALDYESCYGGGFPTDAKWDVLSLWARCETQHNTSYPVIGFSKDESFMDIFYIDIEYICYNGSTGQGKIENGTAVQTDINYADSNRPYSLLSEAERTCKIYGCILGFTGYKMYQMAQSPIVISCYRDQGVECELDCSSHAECRGTPGNYSCVCEPGFTGNGYNCTGISPPANNCTPTTLDCMNTNVSDVDDQTSTQDIIGTDEGSTSHPNVTDNSNQTSTQDIIGTDEGSTSHPNVTDNSNQTSTQDIIGTDEGSTSHPNVTDSSNQTSTQDISGTDEGSTSHPNVTDGSNQTSTQDVTPSQSTEVMQAGFTKLPTEWVATAVSLSILLLLSIATSLVICAAHKVRRTARRRRMAKQYDFVFGKGLWDEVDHNFNPVSIEPNPAMRYSPAVSIFEKLEKWHDSDKEGNCDGETSTISSSVGLSLNSNSSGFMDHEKLLHNGHTICRPSDLQPLNIVGHAAEEAKESPMDMHSSGIGSPQESSDTTSLVSGKDKDRDNFESVSRSMATSWSTSSCGYTTNEQLFTPSSKAQQSGTRCTPTDFRTTHHTPGESPFDPHHDTTGSSGYGSEYTGMDAHLHEQVLLHDTTGSSGYASEYNAPSDYLSSDAFPLKHSANGIQQLVSRSTVGMVNKPCVDCISSQHFLLNDLECEDVTKTGIPQELMETPGNVSMQKLKATMQVPPSVRTMSCSPPLDIANSEVYQNRSHSSCGLPHISLSDYEFSDTFAYDCDQNWDFRNRIGEAATSPKAGVTLTLTSLHVPRQGSTSPSYNRGYITTESLLVGRAN